MKYNDNLTAKLILKKSSEYMKLSLVMFISMIMLVCFSLLFYFSYSKDNMEKFSENEIVHIISLDGCFQNDSFRNMSYEDLDKINNLFIKENIKIENNFFYSFLGATIDNEKNVNIIGVNKSAEKLILDGKMQDDCFYTNDYDGRNLTVTISKFRIDEDGNGMSDESCDVKKTRKSIKNTKSIDCFTSEYENLVKIYVTEKTFIDLCRINMEEFANENNLTMDKLSARVIVEAAYIKVDDIYEVERAAEILENEGYSTKYTFSAFDSMGKSIHKNGILFFTMVIIMLVVSSINLLLSLAGYIKIGQKDMGILKFMSYSNKRIYKIYSRNILKIFTVIWIVAVMGIGILAKITLEKGYGNVVVGMIVGMTIMVGALYFIITQYYLKKIISKDMLYLIKESKQFE